jgi:hypothetical protein
LGGRFINGSGASRGEVVNVRLDVIASEAKQSISPRKGRMDCFVASLLAMTIYDGVERITLSAVIVHHRVGA